MGLLTLRSQRLSQFELHRAGRSCRVSLDTIMISAAAEVLEVDDDRRALGEALEVPESDVRVSDSGAIAIATAPDVDAGT